MQSGERSRSDILQSIHDPHLFPLKQTLDHLGFAQVSLDDLEPVRIRHAMIGRLDYIGSDQLDVLGSELEQELGELLAHKAWQSVIKPWHKLQGVVQVITAGRQMRGREK
jgi:hypothetical protein